MHQAVQNVSIPHALLDLLNQVFEVEKKLTRIEQHHSIHRNVRKMRDLFEDGLWTQHGNGLVYHDPLGEEYDETRTDCDASIAGESMDDLVITEVIKPIVFFKEGDRKQIVQKAVVIAECRPANK